MPAEVDVARPRRLASPVAAAPDGLGYGARPVRRLWLICWVAASVVVLILLAIWQGRAYVAYSDGVYAESARLVTKGLVPYTDFGAAQPPGIYYAGAVILWLGDSVEALRRGLAVVLPASMGRITAEVPFGCRTPFPQGFRLP